MCKFAEEHTLVNVKIPDDLACSGKGYWKEMQIDSCIAHIVKALQDAGIDMRGSCCGHDSGAGYIELADGRHLWIFDEDASEARERVKELETAWDTFEAAKHEMWKKMKRLEESILVNELDSSRPTSG